MPLSDKVRVEIFIPDVSDPAYSRLSEELGDELSYAFGGCTTILAGGKYCSNSGVILPDSKVESLLFRILADRLENGEMAPGWVRVSFAAE